VGADGALGFDGQRTDDKKFQMTSDLVGMGDRLRRQELAGSIIGAFFDVYNALGYGLLESVYAAGLAVELSSRGHVVEREVFVDVYYKGNAIARQRIDMIVDRVIAIEIKATDVLPRFTYRQLLAYLTVTRLEIGLILHFGPRARFYRMVSTNRRSNPSASSA
jgi:GxxExxY protein